MELSDPSWKDRWACAAGGADFQAIVAGMIADQGEAKTADWLAGLKANARILQNNIATMKSVNAGEIPCGVIYHYYWYRDQAGTKEGSGNTALHYFKNQTQERSFRCPPAESSPRQQSPPRPSSFSPSSPARKVNGCSSTLARWSTRWLPGSRLIRPSRRCSRCRHPQSTPSTSTPRRSSH